MNLNVIRDTLSAISTAAMESCLDRLGSVYVMAKGSDTVLLPGPPLTTNLTLMGVDLQGLCRAFHATEVDLDEFRRVFRLFMSRRSHVVGNESGDALLDAASNICPGLRLTPPVGASAMAGLIQVMWSMQWAGYPVKINNERICVTLPDGRYVIYRRAIQSPTGYFKPGTDLGVPLMRCITYPMCRPRRSNGKLGALYLHLSHLFPDTIESLQIVFGAAVHADCQAELIEAFDIELVGDDTPNPTTKDRYSPHEEAKQMLQLMKVIR